MKKEKISKREVENGDDNSSESENVFRKVNREDSGKEILMAFTVMEGCPPCKNLDKAVDSLEEVYSPVIFRSFDPHENPEAHEFHMDIGLLGHPSIVITDGKYIFWKMGAGSVEKEKKFYSELFDAMLEGEIEMNREEEKVEVTTEELGKLSFKGQVIG